MIVLICFEIVQLENSFCVCRQGQLMAQFRKSVGMERDEEGRKITAAICGVTNGIAKWSVRSSLCKFTL